MSKTIAQLQEQLRLLKTKLSEEQRKAETRRKILYGVALLKGIETGAIQQSYIKQLLNRFITKKGDRDFLGLAPLTEQQPAPTQAVTASNNQAQEHNNHNY